MQLSDFSPFSGYWVSEKLTSSWVERGGLLRVRAEVGKVARTLALVASVTGLASFTVDGAQVIERSGGISMRGPPSVSSESYQTSRFFLVGDSLSSTVQNEYPDFDEESRMEADELFQASALNSFLKRVRSIEGSFAPGGPAIDKRTVRFARIIAHQLPAKIPPSVGFDGEGNVFLHFVSDKGDGYLTIEPEALHLFCKVSGRPNVYIDDVSYSGKRLPKSIRDTLSNLFAA